MANLYNYLINLINNYSVLGYFIISTLAFFESFAFIGLIIPGSISVIIGGFLAAHGTMDLRFLFVFIFLAAVAGDYFSFHLGKNKKITFKKENRFFKTELLTKGKTFFKRYGAKSVFLGRFIGWVRPVVPFTAGLFMLETKSFLFWDILSVLFWAAAHLALGYFFGRSWQLISLWSTRASIFFVFLILFLILFYLLKSFAVRKGKLVYQIMISLWLSIKEAILESSEVQKLIENHSSFFSSLKKRFDNKSFWGLPLTLFSLALIYILALFGGIIEDFINSELITQIDVRIENLLVLFRNSALTSFFFWITFLAKWQVIAIFSAAAAFLFWLWNKRIYIAALILSISGSSLFASIGKVIFQRGAPAAAIYQVQSFSFPSFQATIAVAFYGFLAYFLIKNIDNWKRKINILFITLLIILFIGFSRLYLGVRYFSDIWAGYLLGASWLIIAVGITEYLLRVKKSGINNISDKYKKIISTAAIIAALGLFSLFGYNYQFPNLTGAQTEKTVFAESPISIFKDNSLKYTETLLGTKEKSLSFIILAENDKQLTKLFQTTDWQLCDKITIFNLYKLARAAVYKKDYAQAPITPNFWNSKVPDFNFEKSIEPNNLGQRYQIRIWKSNYILDDGSKFYLGTVDFSTGFKWVIIHKINPNLNSAREFLAADLKSSPLIKKIKEKNLVENYIGKNFSGDLFFTDGNIYIFYLE